MIDIGTYVLVIDLRVQLRLQIGKLGIHNLQPGHYIYVGSALGGLSSRLKRHLRSKKKLHWHIDYLLRQADVAQIWYTIGQDRLECKWNTVVQSLPRAMPSIPRFGASDCRCSSHLTYFQATPCYSLFKKNLKRNKLLKIQRHNDFNSSFNTV